MKVHEPASERVAPGGIFCSPSSTTTSAGNPSFFADGLRVGRGSQNDEPAPVGRQGPSRLQVHAGGKSRSRCLALLGQAIGRNRERGGYPQITSRQLRSASTDGY